MVDVVVVWDPVVLDHQLVGTASVGPVINGGDAAGRHPTQIIIDLFAIEQLVGPIDGPRVGLRGERGGVIGDDASELDVLRGQRMRTRPYDL